MTDRANGLLLLEQFYDFRLEQRRVEIGLHAGSMSAGKQERVVAPAINVLVGNRILKLPALFQFMISPLAVGVCHQEWGQDAQSFARDHAWIGLTRFAIGRGKNERVA